MNLRDHDKSCEHPTANVPYSIPGKYYSADTGFWACSVVGCPGGKAVDALPGIVTAHGYNSVLGHGVQGPWVYITVYEDLTIGDHVEVFVLKREDS